MYGFGSWPFVATIVRRKPELRVSRGLEIVSPPCCSSVSFGIASRPVPLNQNGKPAASSSGGSLPPGPVIDHGLAAAPSNETVSRWWVKGMSSPSIQ